MIKKIALISIITIPIMLTGCSKSNEDILREEIANGLKSESYEELTKMLETEVNNNGENDELRSIYRQVRAMRNANKLTSEDKNKDALKELNLVKHINNGSYTMKVRIERACEELADEVYYEKKAQLKRKENAKITAEEAVKSLEKDAFDAQLKYLEELNPLDENPNNLPDSIFDSLKPENIKDFADKIKDKLNELKKQ